jgi:uroporphyrinogen decarboxylase
MSERSQLPWMEEELLQRLHVDTRPVFCGDGARKPAYFREDRLRASRACAEDAKPEDGAFVDEWEVVRRAVPDGQYIVADGPFYGEVTAADLDRYDWPDADDPHLADGMAERARRLHDGTDYAVVVGLPTGVVHQTQFLRGYDHWLMDSALNPELLTDLLTRTTDIWIGRTKLILEAVGDWADVVMFGDDIAMQRSSTLAPEQHRRLIRPHQSRMMRFVREHTRARLLFHTCGDCYDLIPDLIEDGVQALNPVQVSAGRLGDTARLKREFGDRLCFWGAIDTQHVLPHGTPDEVRAEVRRRLDDLGGGVGGYVVSAVHNIQREVPPENILAMCDEAFGREAGRSGNGTRG